jgi:hypothetical protein
MGPESLLLLDGPRHLRRRRLVLPPFHGDRLARYAALMAQITADDLRAWPRGRAFALEPRMRAITLDVILRVVFGIEDARRLAVLRRLFATILPRGAAVLGMLPVARRELGGWSPWARFAANIARIDDVLFGEIARRRADPGLDRREDVLSMLLQARDDDGEPLTDRELRDELMTLLLAGHETTTVALAWAFELLFRDPLAFERSVAAARVEDGAGSAWLDAVVAESLRLKPPLPMVVRRLAADAEIAGHRLSAGTRVAPCIYLAHRRPGVYPQPLAFRPERFLERQPDTYAWLPFGGGVRRCVGASFAQLEMRVVLGTVLAAVDLRPASARPHSPAHHRAGAGARRARRDR